MYFFQTRNQCIMPKVPNDSDVRSNRGEYLLRICSCAARISFICRQTFSDSKIVGQPCKNKSYILRRSKLYRQRNGYAQYRLTLQARGSVFFLESDEIFPALRLSGESYMFFTPEKPPGECLFFCMRCVCVLLLFGEMCVLTRYLFHVLGTPACMMQ